MQDLMDAAILADKKVQQLREAKIAREHRSVELPARKETPPGKIAQSEYARRDSSNRGKGRNNYPNVGTRRQFNAPANFSSNNTSRARGQTTQLQTTGNTPSSGQLRGNSNKGTFSGNTSSKLWHCYACGTSHANGPAKLCSPCVQGQGAKPKTAVAAAAQFQEEEGIENATLDSYACDSEQFGFDDELSGEENDYADNQCDDENTSNMAGLANNENNTCQCSHCGEITECNTTNTCVSCDHTGSHNM
jgi:hypothetical protein